MSHFYGTIDPNNSRKEATKCGNKSTGLTTHAAGWKGAVQVDVEHDETTGQDRFSVRVVPWQGSGGEVTELANGILDASNPDVTFSAGGK